MFATRPLKHLVVIGLLVLGVACGAGWGQPWFATGSSSGPGAMLSDGSFSITAVDAWGHRYVWEWDNTQGRWNRQAWLGTHLAFTTAPGVDIGNGEFFLTGDERSPHYPPHLLRIGDGVNDSVYYGRPRSSPSELSAPSALMYGNRVMVVGGDELYERFLWGATDWETHGMAFDRKPLRNERPCVLRDGSVFVTTEAGEVVQRWWNSGNNTWNWYNHGYPTPFNFFGRGGVKAISVGAAMPQTSKVFVTCADGSLRQIFHDGRNWVWHNHGIPFGWRVDSAAVAISDGKLFVTGSWTSGGTTLRTLLQLYWNGSGWVWHDHGRPPGTSIVGGAATAYGGDAVAVKGADGYFYMVYWDAGASAWLWKRCG